MKSFLAVAAVILLAIGIVGYFRGWYDVNTPKITEDLNTGQEKVRSLFSGKEKDTSQPITPQDETSK